MIVYVARDLRGTILGIYDNEAAARANVEDLVVLGSESYDWRDTKLYAGDLYVGRIESKWLYSAYHKAREVNR